MTNLKYEQLANKPWLKEQLKKMTRRQLSVKLGVPYGCITNRLKDWTDEELAEVSVGRLRWSDKEKLKLVKRAEKRGYAVVAEEAGINRSHLSHWKRHLINSGLFTPTPEAKPVVSDRVLAQRRARRKRRSG